MVEIKRNRYNKKLAWKVMDRDRLSQGQDGYYLEDVQPDYTTNPQSCGQIMQSVTEVLRTRLISSGMTDPWLLDRANIYQRAIDHLMAPLTHAPIPQFLKIAAFAEVDLLSITLLKLFTDKVKLHVTQDSDNKMVFDGYFKYPNDQTKRVSINHKLRRSYHIPARRVTSPSCQIFIKEILGRSTRGGAIAGSDASLRCGLRYGGWKTNYSWCVSINSGTPVASEDPGNQLLKDFGPLTQAYNESRKYPQSFIFIQANDTEDTFHFSDPQTKTDCSQETEHRFWEFNRYLNLILRQLAK